jgi:hypothetical protein
MNEKCHKEQNFKNETEQRAELEHRDKCRFVVFSAAFNLIDFIRASFSTRLIEAKKLQIMKCALEMKFQACAR